MYRIEELSTLIQQMEEKYQSENEDQVRRIAEKELKAWDIICNNLRSKSYKVLYGTAADIVADFTNYCEIYRTNFQLIVKPSPYVQKTIPELFENMSNYLETYENRLKYILKKFKDEFELVKKEFKPLLEPKYFKKLA